MSQHKIVTDYHSLDNSELKKLNRMVVSKNLKLVSFELELDERSMKTKPLKGEFENKEMYQKKIAKWADEEGKKNKDFVKHLKYDYGLIWAKYCKEKDKYFEELNKVKRIQKSYYELNYIADKETVVISFISESPHGKDINLNPDLFIYESVFSFILVGKLPIEIAEEVVTKLRNGHEDAYIAGRFVGKFDDAKLLALQTKDFHIYYSPLSEVFPLDPKR